jgi:uncharacterized protein YneF (UPF0154 family)
MIYWIIGIFVAFIFGYVLGAVIASNGRDEYDEDGHPWH